MQDYYSFYTWAMEKQAQVERAAAERRMFRQSRYVTLRLRWPLQRRRADR